MPRHQKGERVPGGGNSRYKCALSGRRKDGPSRELTLRWKEKRLCSAEEGREVHPHHNGKRR